MLVLLSSVLAKISSLWTTLSSVFAKILSVLAVFSSVLDMFSSVWDKIPSRVVKISSVLVGNYVFCKSLTQIYPTKTAPLVALILFCTIEIRFASFLSVESTISIILYGPVNLVNNSPPHLLLFFSSSTRTSSQI